MSDDQERLGNTSTRFFARLASAGINFRVGVLEAGSMGLDLDSPGFSFVSGVDPGGARALAWQVTTEQYQLDRTPSSATLQVRVGGRTVPRSRVDGFDYDAGARAVVFYGPAYRPGRGAEVVVSYRVWAGSLG